MIMIQTILKKLIHQAVLKVCKKQKIVYPKISEIIVNRPTNPNFGDWTTNIALVLASKSTYQPAEIASFIIEELKQDHLLAAIEEKNGFINFEIAPFYYQRVVKEILKKGAAFGDLKIGRQQKIQVEFGSANPTGPLHIGVGRNLFIGDTLANLFKKAGFRVIKEYYVNDLGAQVKIFVRSVELRYLELFGEKVKFPADGYQGDYPKKLAFEIRQRYGDRFLKMDALRRLKKFTDLVIPLVVKDIDRVCRKIGIKFDRWFFESSLYKKGIFDRALKVLEKKKLLYKKDLALWFKTSKFGQLKDDVVIRADGTPTYFGSDIAYHYDKFIRRRFKRVINVWGADNSGNVFRLEKAVEALGAKGNLEIVLLQYVKLINKRGELIDVSKRKGTFITLEELVDKVGRDVARFFMLMRSPNSHLNFDIDLALVHSEKNPVYYVQYAYARICSILRKIPSDQQYLLEKPSTMNVLELLDHPREIELIKQLEKLPEVIARIIDDHYAIHELPFFAYDLATAFHQFYKHCRVLTEDQELKRARLALIKATQIVFKIAFDLLGIEAKERM